MSIVNKIENISSHLGNAYNSLEDIGADLSHINKNIENLSIVLDTIYDSMPKTSEEGTNLTLNNTRKGKISTMLKGNLSQKTNIITYTCLGTETGDYYFVYDSINYQFTMPTISANDVLVFNTDTLKLYLDTIEISTTTASTGTLITMNTTPNPDYPQDVHVVSGNNTIVVEGKNLAKENIISNGRYNFLLDSIELEANKTYTFSFIPTNNNIGFNIKLNSTGGTIIKQYQGATKDQRYTTTFTLNENGKLFINNYTNGFYAKDIMIEQNNQATAYTPYYVSQSYPISLGNIELCKIGDYQDYIYKENGKWYKHSEIGKVVLDGSEDYRKSDTYSNETYFCGWIYEAIIRPKATADWYNNKFQKGLFTNVLDKECMFIPNKQLHVRILASRLNENSANGFKQWLATQYQNNNPVIAYYVLATPTNTEITDQTLIAQLDNFEKAKSYNNQTNISQENNDLPFIINATALMGNSD